MAYIRAVSRLMPMDLVKSLSGCAAPPLLVGDGIAVTFPDSATVVVMTAVTGSIVVGAVTVRAGIVVPRVVNAAKVVGAFDSVVPLIVVVITMTEAISDAGIAVPSPVPVNCGGIDKVAVFGFAAGSPA